MGFSFLFSRMSDDPKATDQAASLQALLQEIKSVNASVNSLKSQNEKLVTDYNELKALIVEDSASEPSHQPVVPSTPFLGVGSARPNNSTPAHLLGVTPKRPSGSPSGKPIVESSDSDGEPARPVKRKKSKKHKKKRSRRHSSSSSSSSSSSDESSHLMKKQMKELLDGYDTAKPRYLEDKTTDPIHDGLAKLLQTWFWTPFTTDEVKDLLLKPLHPSNAEALIPCRINEPVFYNLLGGGVNKDQPVRFIQNALVKACQPLASAWATIIKVESYFKSQNEQTAHELSDDLTLDFHQLRTQLDLSLRLLGVANSQMVLHRREILSGFLNPDFAKLCKPHVKFNQWMFGTDFKTLLQDTIRENQLIKKGQQKPKAQPQGQQSFLGGKKNFRGRFQGKQSGSRFRTKKDNNYGKGSPGTSNYQQPQQSTSQKQPNKKSQ